MKCAFAIYARGDMFMRLRENLVSKLNKYVPGVPVIDIDDKEALQYLHKEDPWMMSNKAYTVRLAIPFMNQFKEYDRVIWMDCDIDIVSDGFSEILMCETSKDGFAMSVDIIYKKHMKRLDELLGHYGKESYFNAGVTVMDLQKINKDKLRDAISDLKEKKYKFRDQDTLNINFDIKSLDRKFNFWTWTNEKINEICAIHYVGRHKKVLYDILQTEDKGGAPPVDSIFAIGKSSDRENEKLRLDTCIELDRESIAGLFMMRLGL